MKVLNPGPEEIRDSLVITAVDEQGDRHITRNVSDINESGRLLGILSNNKWNVNPFLEEMIRLLKADFAELEIEFQKKLNASQTASRELVSKIALRTHFAITGIGD
jgi:hypothetical protein